MAISQSLQLLWRKLSIAFRLSQRCRNRCKQCAGRGLRSASPERRRRHLRSLTPALRLLYRHAIHKPSCARGERMPAMGPISDKTRAEHNESAHPPIADMQADIDFCRSGPCVDGSGLAELSSEIAPLAVPAMGSALWMRFLTPLAIMRSASAGPEQDAFDTHVARVGCPDRRTRPALHYVQLALPTFTSRRTLSM